MFGRKKPSAESAAVMPPIPANAAELPKTGDDDLPPLPTNLQRFSKTAPTAPATASPPSSNPANPASPNPQGPSMSDSNSSSPSTPTFRPEIPKRPAIDLGPRPASAPAAVAPVTSTRSDAPDPKVLIIGREISLTGQITACDKVIVEGKVEATLTESRFVEIAESGQFKGSAEVEEAEVRGRFEGKLSVRGRLLIRGSGKVMGEIAYGQIEVECGGEISGTVQTVASSRMATSAAA